MVRMYLELALPPVRNAEEDRVVELGPNPQEAVEGPPGGTHPTLRVPRSLLQAYLAAQYGTNWLMGAIHRRRINLPPGSPVPYCITRYPGLRQNPPIKLPKLLLCKEPASPPSFLTGGPGVDWGPQPRQSNGMGAQAPNNHRRHPAGGITRRGHSDGRPEARRHREPASRGPAA